MNIKTLETAMKKPQNMLILAAVLLVIGGGVYYVKTHPKKESAGAVSATGGTA